MEFIQRIRNSFKKTGTSVIIIGLRDVTDNELQEYKKQLNEHNIEFKHVTENLPYNGIIKVYRKGKNNGF